MSTFLCENAEKNCKYWQERTPFEIGENERIRCPNCNSDQVVRVSPPASPRVIFLKRFAIVAAPVICGGLVWLYAATRPAPPFAIGITYASPPTAKIHPGDQMTWTMSVEGLQPAEKPTVSAESLSPSVLPRTGLHLVKLDSSGLTNREYKLIAEPIGTDTGLVKITVSVGGDIKVRRKQGLQSTNLAFEVVSLGPPLIALPDSVARIMESNHDSLALPFTVSDEKAAAKDLIFSAAVDPSDRVRYNVQTDGATRTVTLSRNQWESGPVRLAARLVTPDGREANQTVDITVAC